MHHFFCLLGVFFFSLLFSFSLPEGNERSFMGYNVDGQLTGFTGLSGDSLSSWVNPALFSITRIQTGIGFEGIGRGMNTSLFGGIPTPLGNLGAKMSYTASSEAVFQMDILWSRAISRWFSLGGMLNTGVINNQGFFSFDVGMVHRGGDERGIGFLQWDYGIVLKNMGSSVRFSYGAWKPFMIGIGGGFSPLVMNGYSVRFQSDLLSSFDPIAFSWGVGMRHLLFETLTVAAGYQFPLGKYGIWSNGVFSAGLGIKMGFALDRKNTNLLLRFGKTPSSEYTEWELWYGITGTPSLTHNFMLHVSWGQYDDRPPLIKTNNPLFFSPNVDGIKDEALIPLVIEDNGKLSGWEVEIVDGKGAIVRRFQSWQPLEDRTLSLKNIWQRLTTPDRGIEIPETIAWDGKDIKGTLLPDGVYRYRIRARDLTDNETITPWQLVVLDTAKRILLPDLSQTLFSPNNDGNKDLLVIPITNIISLPGDRLFFAVRTLDGKVLFEKSWTNEGGLPSRIEWDGKTNNTLLPEGSYVVTLTLESESGNSAAVRTPVRMVTSMESVSIIGSTKAFSAFKGDVITITPKISSQDLLSSWRLVVRDTNNTLVRETRGTSPVPISLVWDGRDNQGTLVKDGPYTLELQLFYESGNQPFSERLLVRIDNTPPSLQVKLPYTIFSPLPDSRQRTLPITLAFRAATNDLATLSLVDESGSVFFYEQKPVSEWGTTIEWLGLDNKLQPLPEGKYRLIAEVVDEVGHRFQTNIFPITLRTGRERLFVNTPSAFVSPLLQSVVLFTLDGNPQGIRSLEFTISDESGRTIFRVQTNQWLSAIPWNIGSLKDGIYTYRASALYEDGQNPTTVSRRLEIDSVPPVLKPSVDKPAFSPNNDGRRDTLSLLLQSEGRSNDFYQVLIFDDKGTLVKSTEWRGPFMSHLVWNGKDDKGKDLPEGNYIVRASAIDAASNMTIAFISNIFLARNYSELSFEVNDTIVEPSRQPLIMMGYLSETNRVEENEVLILNQQGEVVYRRKSSFWTNLFVWNGEGQSGQVNDGYYIVQWNVSYLDGNYIRAELEDIIVDSQPPMLSLAFSPLVFTPDNDGENDTMEIKTRLWDLAGLKTFSVQVHKLRENKEPLLVKQWQRSFTNELALFEETFSWNGIGDDNELVESVQEYQLTVTATDVLGHWATSRTNFTTGVLVERTPDGLRIRMSSVRFALNSATITAQSRENLDKVVAVFQRLLSQPERYALTKDFFIEISGHTDDLPGPAPDFNQKLSERRAKAVYEYLVSRGIPASKLTWVGYGESRPYKPITSDMTKDQKDEYRSRNRRVEFFIRKKQ